MNRQVLGFPTPAILSLQLSRIAFACVLASVFMLFQGSVRAQDQSAAATSAAPPAAKSVGGSTAVDNHYRIGPGDVLDVKVFGKPQFDRLAVRVDPRGMIRMTLVKEEIRAACRTEEELAADITTLLREYIREPQVTVEIKEYQSEPVAVLGSVRT